MLSTPRGCMLARCQETFVSKKRQIAVRWVAGFALLLIFGTGGSALAQQYGAELFSGMRWRCIGPFRGGRTVAISGVGAVERLESEGGNWRSGRGYFRFGEESGST